ncbi:fimbrial assembly protein [delta proteobacterium NaphS2]|nr:fimbrial assembly protein [delta proteobacterium NaphS2]
MIKINLLPFRAARKRENVRRQVSIYFLCILFLFCIMGYLHVSLGGQLSQLKTREEVLRKELKSYAAVTQEIAKLEKDSKDLDKKLKVIKSLEKQRVGPVLLLVDIAQAVPFDRLWLDSVVETSGRLSLQGTAMDNHTVARFMTRLENAPHIETVDLDRTSLKYFPEYKRRASNFVLTCKTDYKEPEPGPETKPKKEKGGRR